MHYHRELKELFPYDKWMKIAGEDDIQERVNLILKIIDPSHSMIYHDYNQDFLNKETEVSMMEQLFDDIYDKIKDLLKKV